MYNLRKVYGGGKVALQNMSLAVRNECFALLGPNGAGKTTAISVLTGLYPPSGGGATVGGFDVRTQMDNVYSVIGVCPQFDCVHPGLTVREHLLFYSRVKGTPAEAEADAVERAMKAIGLSGRWADTPAEKLSGGMRRRLTLGISFIGNPKCVFLDEPTTGLDPETRRAVWRLIERARLGRAVVLTTHAMDEADALSQRIGIMAKGTLRCLGSGLYLKNKFGGGFKIDVNFDSALQRTAPERVEAIKRFVMGIAPNATIEDAYMGRLTFSVRRDHLRVSELFARMLARPHDSDIVAWALRQSSLEEVFLMIAKEAEAEGEA